MIYSIGYQGLRLARLCEIAEHLRACVWDVRGVPHSRNPSYTRASLSAALGGRYVWMGATLGNKGAHRTTPEGLASLRALSPAKSVILLCMEAAPGDCHRHFTIATALLPGLDTTHIFGSELVLASELARALAQDDDYEFTELGLEPAQGAALGQAALPVGPRRA